MVDSKDFTALDPRFLFDLDQPQAGGTRHYPQSARYIIFPPTIVAATFPVNCQLSNGVLCDSDRDLAASNVQRFLGSKMVTSAKLPRTSDPRPRRSKTRAGPAVKSSTMRVRGILCSRCSFVMARASAVSSPVMPKDACSNSTCFS